MIRHVVDAGYEEYLQENYANYESRLEDLEQLASFSQQFKAHRGVPHPAGFALQPGSRGRQASRADTEQIRLSTIHQAKGLEFGVVFVIMLCDGLFPSARSFDGRRARRKSAACFTSP